MHICLWGIAAAIASRIALVAVGVAPWVCYFELPTRMDSLLAGAFLALLIRRQDSANWLRPTRLRWILSGFGVAIALVLLKARGFSYTSLPMIYAGYSMVAGAYASILALTLIPGTPEYRIGNIAILRFFGRYSYGLYVWHVIPIGFCRSVIIPWFHQYLHPAMLADTAYTSVMLAFFTAVAVLSYHLVERPFIKLKSKFLA
jgi:peptidoglycan/LPS O-acetylase OafA/YrhL